jgi:beta-1,4-N-acetylglucosaminyltransferase
MKIALVCSHGGHLTELMYLAESFDEADTFLMTYDSPRTRAIESRKLLFPNIGERPHELLRLIPQIIHILLEEKPEVIISNGAELAIPFFYIGKALGIKTIFIECYTRVNQPTFTGKLVYPVSDLFLVLWPEMLKEYGHRAEYWGGLFDTDDLDCHVASEGKDGILVITGMHSKGFYRLIRRMDEIAGNTTERVVIQIGDAKCEPQNAEFFRFTDGDTIRKMMKKSRLVVAQGAMTVVESSLLGTPALAVPRSKKHGEIINDHQLLFSKRMEELGITRVIEDLGGLEEEVLQKRFISDKRIILNRGLVLRLKEWLGNLDA